MTTEVTPPPATELSTAAARADVPWPTVVSLGVLLAYTNGFWTTSLREAVGSIERTSSPFSAWLRESTLLVPLFVLAVLGALTLVRRRHGPVLRGRTLLVAALLVAAAGTLAGVAELAVSSMFDYRLQLATLDRMGTMGGRCVGSACLDGQREATLALQLKAVGYGSGILLASNLVFVGWAVALMGGRLRVERTTVRPRRVQSRYDDLRMFVAVGLAGSAVIHAAVVPQHVLHWPAAGMFFVVLTVLQLLAADRVVSRPGRIAWLGALLVSIGPLVLWGYSRTLGLPFGPEAGEPEAVGLADVASGLLEVAALVGAVALLRTRAWTRREPASAHLSRVAVVAVLAVTAIGVGSALTLFGGAAGHEHGGVETSEAAGPVAPGRG